MRKHFKSGIIIINIEYVKIVFTSDVFNKFKMSDRKESVQHEL
jgi:hypothetical protein